MVSYRKKIFIIHFVILLIFLTFLFLFTGKIVQKIAQKSIEERTRSVIHKIASASSLSHMIEYLQRPEYAKFSRITLLDWRGDILYDSHVDDLEDESLEFIHPEIAQTLEKGRGYREEYSSFFSEDLGYVAIVFQTDHGKYVLQTASPLDSIKPLIRDLKVSFLAFGILILLLFFSVSSIIWHRLAQPIQKILNAIHTFNEGKEKFLSKIELDSKMGPDDFRALANTLNFQSQKIKQQIETLTAQKNENERILESLIEGIIAVDRNDDITFVNSKAADFLNFPKKYLLYQSLQSLAKNVQAFREIIEIKKSSQEKKQILVHPLKLFKSKKKIYLDLIVIPRESGMILVFQDKTSDYKMLEMGKDFIANASHELKTPITIIRGFAETLQTLPKVDKKMLQQITEKIVRTCDRLNGLVKSLLTLADIEHLDSAKLYKLDLIVIIENCIDLLKSNHEEVSIQFIKQSKQCFISGDVNLLDLAITNILENAVRYSIKPANIKIYLKEERNRVYLSLEDQGIGIPKEDLDHIFERFYTVDKARSRKSGGVGLGLSIVKTIMENHQATLCVQSTLGEGTLFTARFPKLVKD